MSPRPRPLPQKKRAILDAVAAGKSNKEISSETGLSVGTVKQYLSVLLCPRFGAANRTELAVLWATEFKKEYDQ